ncbi:N-acetyltransferase [Photobacterium sp. CAIM 1938]|uniref:GNAT family N-acetyltransferase n=1 Tax=Photobacterium lucens TaxID=2562949 RepID=UPI00136AD78D|nr:GNAT family N-acetyltransferase [Photobacterium lucens]MBP2701059.1 GNAT family N-acetyltransferase [Vibrio parahaemolyticus]MZG79993.1 N-acetyltransferase [Photobacterium lucens]
MHIVCETEALVIRKFELTDTDFIIRLLNEELFIRYIADKGVRSHEDAIRYLTQGPMACYEANGFGLNMVILKSTNTAIGMCGLLKRPELTCPDLGYAFLSQYCGKGYAFEAAEAVIADEMKRYGLTKIQAVTYPDNIPSNQLLIKLGFDNIGKIELYGSTNNLYQFGD